MRQNIISVNPIVRGKKQGPLARVQLERLITKTLIRRENERLAGQEENGA